jgi:hypothetical protein
VAKKKPSLVHRLLCGEGSQAEADMWRTSFLRDDGKLYHYSLESGFYPAARSCRGKVLIGVSAHQLLCLPAPAEG